jgi:hypothetical protein
LKAGKLQGAHDHIARTPLLLDAEGERNIEAIAKRATGEVEDEQREVAKRLKKTNGEGGTTGYTFALLAFEAAWEPPDPRVFAAQAANGTSAPAKGANGGRRNGGGKKSGKRKARAAGK